MNKTLTFLIILLSSSLVAQESQLSKSYKNQGIYGSFMEDLMIIRDIKSKRISSFDTSGANHDYIDIKAGETKELGFIEGAGCIKRFYCALGSPDRQIMRKVVLRMYWDDEKEASVEVPLGDFFGIGEGIQQFNNHSMMFNVNPGSDNWNVHGLVNYFPMPFGKNARITITNEGFIPVVAFWYHIDYEEYDQLANNVGRFHAQWRRENLTSAAHLPENTKNVQIWQGKNKNNTENYTILDAEGAGNFAGYILNVNNVAGGWYGEGDDMIFIDGEAYPPSYHGTGSEEIFNGGACPDVNYQGLYTGFSVSNRDFSGKNSMYRLHISDPIRFSKSINVSIEHGHGNNFENDYSSTAFWYQTEPHKPFPKLPSVDNRIPLLSEEGKKAEEREMVLFLPFMQLFGMNSDLLGPEFKKRIEEQRYTIGEAHRLQDYNTMNKALDELEKILEEGKAVKSKK